MPPFYKKKSFTKHKLIIFNLIHIKQYHPSLFLLLEERSPQFKRVTLYSKNIRFFYYL